MADRLPKRIAVDYYKEMRRHIRYMEQTTQKAYQERIIPLILKYQEAVREEAVRELKTNALLGELSSRLSLLYTATQAAISNELIDVSMEIQSYFTARTIGSTVTRFINRINVTDKKNIEGDIKKVTKKEPTKIKGLQVLEDQGTQAIVRQSINENVKLIQSIPQDYFKDIEEVIYKGLEEGRLTSSMGEDIADIGGVSERRGQFIARDQLGTVHGTLTQRRQENLGIRRFKWLTSEDNRVRDSHKALNGRVFSWDEGAQGENVAPEVRGLVPGQDYNCRCTSTIDDDDIFDLLDRLEERGL